MVKINWYVCKDVGWCDLFKIDINHRAVVKEYGIYIVWKGTGVDGSRIILSVGQGFIREEILKLREDDKIKGENEYGIFMTWSKLPEYHLNGVEVYLNEKFKPKFKKKKLPDENPKKAELPWDDSDDSIAFEQMDFDAGNEGQGGEDTTTKLPF